MDSSTSCVNLKPFPVSLLGVGGGHCELDSGLPVAVVEASASDRHLALVQLAGGGGCNGNRLY